jgi:hypothetical protein
LWGGDLLSSSIKAVAREREAEMIQRGWLRWTILALVLSGVVGCRTVDAVNPFKTFTPGDLVGTWRTEYTGIEYFAWDGTRKLAGVETLTLRADGTYQQIYDDGMGYKYTSPWNKWRLERGYILHLAGGRFYGLGIRDAESYAHGADLTVRGPGNEKMELIGEMVFFVYPASSKGGAAQLVSPPIPLTDPDTPTTVLLYRVSTVAPTPEK